MVKVGNRGQGGGLYENTFFFQFGMGCCEFGDG